MCDIAAVSKRSHFAVLALMLLLSASACPAGATGRGFFAYIRIQGNRPGEAGTHFNAAATRMMTQQVATATAAPSPAHGLHNNAVIAAAPPSSSPAPGAITEPCSAIILDFAPAGQYSVQGSYMPDANNGCLFSFALPANAPEIGTLGWHERPQGGHMGFGAGKAAYQPIKTPGPAVTLAPGKTITVGIGYDGNTNSFQIWQI
ncbi:MAG: hypothetical protein JO194_06710 [Candidatus Eremiobacteraeota bacterium]|nr:hypothetical protein [Candidatus Eremiobacteraeota bacterium]